MTRYLLTRSPAAVSLLPMSAPTPDTRMEEMSVADLKKILENFSDDDGVVVALHKKEGITMFEIEGYRDNAGLQLSVYDDNALRPE